eukprot:RCo041264
MDARGSVNIVGTLLLFLFSACFAHSTLGRTGLATEAAAPRNGSLCATEATYTPENRSSLCPLSMPCPSPCQPSTKGKYFTPVLYAPTNLNAPPSPRVALLIPYFGRLPRWFPLFCKTVSYNPGFDWLIFTEKKFEATGFELPPNLIFYNMSMLDFCGLLAQRLGVRPMTSMPSRKVCDTKPFFGDLFREYVEGYDFWGYTDLDILYGNISRWITPEVLRNNDVVTVFSFLAVGDFTLYRRSPAVARLPFMMEGYLPALNDLTTKYGMDEWVGKKMNIAKVIRQEKDRGALRVWSGPEPWASVSFVQQDQYYPCQRSHVRCIKTIPPRVRIYWRQGQMWRSGHPNFPRSRRNFIMYYHFIRTKRRVAASYSEKFLSAEQFCVNGSHHLSLTCP